MEFAKVILDNGLETEVNGLFYIYNSNYYFLYTEKELDDNGYVILKLVQVGKETRNTENGVVETGYMIGIEPSDWENAKKSITQIVEDKKGEVANSEVRYLPINMLSTLKISKFKVVKLIKSIVEQYFDLKFASVNTESTSNLSIVNSPVSNSEPIEGLGTTGNEAPNLVSFNSYSAPASLVETPAQLNIESSVVDNAVENAVETKENQSEVNDASFTNDDVIIDYRKSFFEEQEKNKVLEEKIKDLTEKLNKIKEIIG